MADNDPVITRLGPRSRPMSRARGWAGGRAESRTAAGRLLMTDAVPTPTQAVAQDPSDAMRRAGPSQSRATVPSAVARTNRRVSRGTFTARAVEGSESRPIRTWAPATNRPVATTETAGVGTHNTTTER